MGMINFSLKHGRTLAEARAKMEQTVAELQRTLAGMVSRVEWGPERNSVVVEGTGFRVTMRADEEFVYVEGDIPFLAKLLGAPAVAKLKQTVERTFQKKLEG